MYSTVLTLHSIIRWLVVLAGLAAAGRAVYGWLNQKEWMPVDKQLGLAFTISMDVQVLLGLLLYVFLSPVTQLAFSDFGVAMSDPELRFFLLEHIFYMILAVALAHAGRALVKRTTADAAKHKKTAILFGLAMAAIFLAIPWGRPLLPFG